MTTRTHIVLVPGFGGFDALGQLRYYAGVTPRFHAWRASRGGAAARAALHYFDNLPTAPVATRGRRLREYLAKRVARGEIQPGDGLALVGHSTGGLDVRWLLGDLYGADGARASRVDGGADVPTAAMRALGPRAVFLSVPQRGTNLAQWVRAHAALREGGPWLLDQAIERYRLDPVRWLERSSVGFLADHSDEDLLLAVKDALAESDDDLARAPAAGRSPADVAFAVAAAREAYADLALWLRHVDDDTGALDDLLPVAPDHPPLAAERARLRAEGVRTRSYATVAPSPFAPGRVDDGRPWSPLDPRGWAEVLRATPGRPSDLAYRRCYRACAGGGFAVDEAAREATPLGGGAPRRVEAWESDGIVNTASMLWPDGADTVLVEADHGDVIGHHGRVQAPAEARRRSARAFEAYDLLDSGAGFDAARFGEVWDDVFDFCVAP